MLGKIEVRKRRKWQRIRFLDNIADSKDINLSKLWEIVKEREAGHTAVCVVTENQTQISDRTATQDTLMRFHMPQTQECNDTC